MFPLPLLKMILTPTVLQGISFASLLSCWHWHAACTQCFPSRQTPMHHLTNAAGTWSPTIIFSKGHLWLLSPQGFGGRCLELTNNDPKLTLIAWCTGETFSHHCSPPGAAIRILTQFLVSPGMRRMVKPGGPVSIHRRRRLFDSGAHRPDVELGQRASVQPV